MTLGFEKQVSLWSLNKLLCSGMQQTGTVSSSDDLSYPAEGRGTHINQTINYQGQCGYKLFSQLFGGGCACAWWLLSDSQLDTQSGVREWKIIIILRSSTISIFYQETVVSRLLKGEREEAVPMPGIKSSYISTVWVNSLKVLSPSEDSCFPTAERPALLF